MPATYPAAGVSFKNILVPEDFSASSNAAVPFALALARAYQSKIILMHALRPKPHDTVVFDTLPPECDLERQQALEALQSSRRRLQFDHVRVDTLLDRGDMEHVIPRVIEEQHIDLIVLGTRGRRGLGKLVLGSQAEKIYRSATCPVLVIGPRTDSTRQWSIKRILCAVDLAEDPETELRYALWLAEEHHAELLLLHAVPLAPWQHRPAIEGRVRQTLHKLMPAHSDVVPICTVRWENPAEAIVCAAEEQPSDLIVMGVHRARVVRLASHLPWPVASEVGARAGCPVLTVRV